MLINTIVKAVCDTAMVGVLVIGTIMIVAWAIGVIRRRINK